MEIKANVIIGYNGNANAIQHKISSPIAGYKGPYVLSGAFNTSKVVNEPVDQVVTTFYDEAYNVQRCADLCEEITAQRKAIAEQDCAAQLQEQSCQFSRTSHPTTSLSTLANMAN